jgi:hypothetical protein
MERAKYAARFACVAVAHVQHGGGWGSALLRTAFGVFLLTFRIRLECSPQSGGL